MEETFVVTVKHPRNVDPKFIESLIETTIEKFDMKYNVVAKWDEFGEIQNR